MKQSDAADATGATGRDDVDDGALGSEEAEATIAVARDDATIVVARDDATIVVARDDATIVVAREGSGNANANATEHQPDTGIAPAAHSWPAPPVRRGGAAGDPVEEREEIPPELAKLLFKNPLDPKRRAPASPFPVEQSSLPRGGVRGGIPVVYGARGEGFVERTGARDLGRSLGVPPSGYDLPAADRNELPSVARLNRTYSVVAWAGAFVVPVVAGVGLWWVLTQLLRP